MNRLGFIALFIAFVATTLWAYAQVTEVEIALKTRKQQSEPFEVPEHMHASVIQFLGEPLYK